MIEPGPSALEQDDARGTRRFVVRLFVGCIAAFLVLIGLSCFALRMVFPNRFDDKEFVRSTWLKDPDNRGPMVVSLLAGPLEMGSAREQVLRLLGKPELQLTGDTKKFYEEQLGRPWHRIDGYVLGAWSGWQVDGDYLYLFYDNDDRVRETLVVQG